MECKIKDRIAVLRKSGMEPKEALTFAIAELQEESANERNEKLINAINNLADAIREPNELKLSRLEEENAKAEAESLKAEEALKAKEKAEAEALAKAKKEAAEKAKAEAEKLAKEAEEANKILEENPS